MQTDADAAEYCPMGQVAVTADSPIVAQYDPAEHAIAAVRPVVGQKLPILQLLHNAWPALTW